MDAAQQALVQALIEGYQETQMVVVRGIHRPILADLAVLMKLQTSSI
jgi:hypothetical protein